MPKKLWVTSVIAKSINPDIGDNNHNSGEKLPIKWYYSWWVFILLSTLTAFMLSAYKSFVSDTAGFLLSILAIISFVIGFSWAILRGKHIEQLQKEKDLAELYNVTQSIKDMEEKNGQRKNSK